MRVFLITKLMLLFWLDQLTEIDGKVIQKCYPLHSVIKLGCPANHFISIHSAKAGFIIPSWTHSDDGGKCLLNGVTCTLSTEFWDATCYEGERKCTTHIHLSDFDITHCDQSQNINVIMVEYNCLRDSEAFHQDGRQIFGCERGQITINSAEVGVVSQQDDSDWQIDDECLWPINQTLIEHCNGQRRCHVTSIMYSLTPTSCSGIEGKKFIRIEYSCVSGESTDGSTVAIESTGGSVLRSKPNDVITTTTDSAKRTAFLSRGAVIGIIVGGVLLLLLVIVLLVIVICLCRRSRSSKTSHVENPYADYELADDVNSQYAGLHVQSEASAPAGRTQPSAPHL